ncbi:prostasin-like [Oppia nitens]|uniref:prostasin-like n=1 Tax=Oppia nitens TaxID=1686743 RepID=UPI0023DBD621|nr:prostasin-like [Oppia nitens]
MADLANGRDARPGELPFIAFITKWQSSFWPFPDDMISFCTGTIITNQWILTAAHCVRKQNVYYKVNVGLIDKSNKGRDYGYDKIIMHENYRKGNDKYDLALIKLNDVLDFKQQHTDRLINAICLPQPNDNIPYNEYALTTGFGLISDNVLDDKLKMGWTKIANKTNKFNQKHLIIGQIFPRFGGSFY